MSLNSLNSVDPAGRSANARDAKIATWGSPAGRGAATGHRVPLHREAHTRRSRQTKRVKSVNKKLHRVTQDTHSCVCVMHTSLSVPVVCVNAARNPDENKE